MDPSPPPKELTWKDKLQLWVEKDAVKDSFNYGLAVGGLMTLHKRRTIGRWQPAFTSGALAFLVVHGLLFVYLSGREIEEQKHTQKEIEKRQPKYVKDAPLVPDNSQTNP